MTWADALCATAGVPIAIGAAYLLRLTLLSAKGAVPLRGARTPRFRFVVPAHDEAASISDTVASLFAVDYPREHFDVLVVADNCTDDTGAQARAAGASVLERIDTERRGKGYALKHAFEALPDTVDAVVVIDADTVVSDNLLRAFAARIDAGAGALQADYSVRNPYASWRTRLIAIALGAFHVVRSRGRERLRLSCGLRGNGMCFTRDVLRAVPHEAFSIVEDVEYGIRLGRAGHRVWYADEAHVYGEMVSTGAAARTQRARWEGGRKALSREQGWPLLREALRRRDRILLDLATDVLFPPLSRLAVLAVCGLAIAVLLAVRADAPTAFAASLLVWGFSVAALAAYVLRGWAVSGTGARGLLDLMLAPAFVIWKATVRSAPARKDGAWVRTARETGPEGPVGKPPALR